MALEIETLKQQLAATSEQLAQCTTDAQRLAQLHAELESPWCDKHLGEMPKTCPACELAESREQLATEKIKHTQAKIKLRGADRLADAVASFVQHGHLGSRTPPADALLDYRNPPRNERTDRIAEMETEVERLRKALEKQEYDIQQTLRRALGYPRFCDDQKNFPGTTDTDGVCVGEHVAKTIAAEAAGKLAELERQIAELTAKLAAAEAKDVEIAFVDKVAECDRLTAELDETKQALAAARGELERYKKACEPFKGYCEFILSDAEWSKSPDDSWFSRFGEAVGYTMGDIRRFVAVLSEVATPSPAPAQPAASEPADDDDMTDWDRFDESQQAARASEPGDAAEKVEPVKPLRSVDEVLAEINSPEEAMKELRIEQSDDRCDEPEPTERRFVCPRCGCNKLWNEQNGLRQSDFGDDEDLQCGFLHCDWHGKWREVEAAKGEGREDELECTLQDEEAAHQDTLRLWEETKQQLAAANQTREAAEKDRDAWKHSFNSQNGEIRRLSDEMADHEDAIERLREIGKAIGCDHVGGPDERRQIVNCVEQTVQELEQRAEAAEAAAGVMREAITDPCDTPLNLIDGLERQAELSENAAKAWFSTMAANLRKALATDPGRAANDLRVLREIEKMLAEVYSQAGNSAPANRRHALTPGLRDRIRDWLKERGHFDQALAQGEQRQC